MLALDERSDDDHGHERGSPLPFLLVAALAFYGSYLLGTDRFWPAFGLLVLAGGCMYARTAPTSR